MRFRNFLNRLFGRTNGHDSEFAVPKLLKMIAMTDEREIACDEVYALIDQFVEMAARGDDVSRLMPLVQKHLELCPDCREEYEMLLRIVERAQNAASA